LSSQSIGFGAVLPLQSTLNKEAQVAFYIGALSRQDFLLMPRDY